MTVGGCSVHAGAHPVRLAGRAPSRGRRNAYRLNRPHRKPRQAMTIAPTQSPSLKEPGHGESTPLHEAVERLLRAAEADVVRSEAEAFACHLMPGARVAWRGTDEPRPTHHAVIELGTDPQADRFLELHVDSPSADSAELIDWLG